MAVGLMGRPTAIWLDESALYSITAAVGSTEAELKQMLDSIKGN